MNVDFESKLLKVMIGQWLEKRINALTKNKDVGLFGNHARKNYARKVILKTIPEIILDIKNSSSTQKLENSNDTAKIIIETWFQVELNNLKKEIGPYSIKFGIRGHEVTEYILSVLPEICSALSYSDNSKDNS